MVARGAEGRSAAARSHAWWTDFPRRSARHLGLSAAICGAGSHITGCPVLRTRHCPTGLALAGTGTLGATLTLSRTARLALTGPGYSEPHTLATLPDRACRSTASAIKSRMKVESERRCASSAMAERNAGSRTTVTLSPRPASIPFNIAHLTSHSCTPSQTSATHCGGPVNQTRATTFDTVEGAPQCRAVTLGSPVARPRRFGHPCRARSPKTHG